MVNDGLAVSSLAVNAEAAVGVGRVARLRPRADALDLAALAEARPPAGCAPRPAWGHDGRK